MKKALSVIFIISIIVSLICSNNAAAAYAEKSAASGDIESGSEKMKIIIEGGQHEIKAAPGETVEVKIQLKDVKPVVSLKILLNIDEKLSVVMKKDESTGEDVPDVTFETVDICPSIYYNEENRTLILNWLDESYKMEDDTVFATVRFKVAKDAKSGYLPITAYIDPEDVFDKKTNNIDFELITGGIEIEAPAFEPGDTNGDGSVDNKDVVVLFRYVSSASGSEYDPAFDFNGDSAVDNKDVVSLFRYVSAG